MLVRLLLFSVRLLWPWIVAALLGGYHGIDPSMGWLFAVALGLQERSRRKLLGAFFPIGFGHLLSVGLTLLLVEIARLNVRPLAMRIIGAGALIGLGVWRFCRPRAHPRIGGMRVRPWELGLWSFMMASAHGAGLMLMPVMMGLPPAHGYFHHHSSNLVTSSLLAARDNHFSAALLLRVASIVAVHTGSMLLTMTAIALVVYNWIGLAVLRKAWINLNLIWSGALILAGVMAAII